MRFGLSIGDARRTLSTTLKTAAVAPVVRAMMQIAATVGPGV
jgi:hypothetical protein